MSCQKEVWPSPARDRKIIEKQMSFFRNLFHDYTISKSALAALKLTYSTWLCCISNLKLTYKWTKFIYTCFFHFGTYLVLEESASLTRLNSKNKRANTLNSRTVNAIFILCPHNVTKIIPAKTIKNFNFSYCCCSRPHYNLINLRIGHPVKKCITKTYI